MRFNLVIDGNWLLMSRFFSMREWFLKDNDYSDIQKGKDMIKDQMMASINVILNQFKTIDNVILVADGGSWRKSINKPSNIEEIYKGNREKDELISYIDLYESLYELIEKFEENNISAFIEKDVEGDDWISYITKTLNEKGQSCMIWSTDCDLKQLVSCGDGFTCWYNSKSLTIHKDLLNNDDFMISALNPYKDLIINDLKSNVNIIEEIDPQEIIIDKIVSGDKSDNIKAIASITTSKTYSITKKQFAPIKESLNINTIDDILNKKVEIAEKIQNTTKYKNGVDNIVSRIEYNRILVELNQELIPNDLLSKMKEHEFFEFDVELLRHNYRYILDSNDEIEHNIVEILNF